MKSVTDATNAEAMRRVKEMLAHCNEGSWLQLKEVSILQST